MGKRHLGNEKGSAFVELALVLPLLGLILVGAAELGRIAYMAVEVTNAARAGAAYGSQNGVAAGQSANIATAARNDASDVTAITPLTVSSTDYCVCETNASGSVSDTPQLLCTSSVVNAANYCPTSTITGTTTNIVEYVQVSTTATVNTMFRYPGLPTSYTLNGFAQMRVIQN